MKDTDPTSNIQRGHAAAGLTLSGALLTGALGVVGAFAAALGGDFIGSGFLLTSAALAFGLSANAVYRH